MNSRTSDPREPSQDLELWKHHAAAGGDDKNRMVSLSTWLLSFSAAIIWYEATQLIGEGELTGDHALRARMVSGLGLAVSLTSGYVSLMYAGYSNQNWRKADEIAKRNRWSDLIPGEDIHRGWRLNNVAERLAKPCDPFTQIAPVFRVFFLLSASAMVAHLAVFVGSFIEVFSP